MRVHGTPAVADMALVARVGTTGGRLCVRSNGLAPKTREYVVLTGFSPDHNLGVYNNDVDAVTRAFTERYFFCSEQGRFRAAYRVRSNAYQTPELCAFQDAVVRNMPRLPRLAPAQVVEMYSGAKRRVYERAAASLARTALRSTDARLTSFVKFEKQDTQKAPRIINPRTPRYNLELARFLKHAEHHYFKAINRVFGGRTPATVIKGLNADDSGRVLHRKWQQFERPCAIGLDATKFDMHVSPTALRYEHAFYLRLWSHHPTLRKLLRWQLRNSGCAYVADGTVEFAMEGTRCSGDINTSLGNCLLMCALVHAYAAERGVTIELANNGDDCVVFLERDDELKFAGGLDEWFKRRGFAMAVEATVHEFEEVEFCQTHPVRVGGEWRMVRSVAAVLRKDAMCLIPVPNQRVWRMWLDAVGTCGAMLCAGVPVLGEYYRMYKRWGLTATSGLVQETFRNRSQLQLAQGVRDVEITDDARCSFYYAFGITPDRQLAMEQVFRDAKITTLDDNRLVREALVLSTGTNVVNYE